MVLANRELAMKLTTKSLYAVSALIDVAIQQQQGPVTLRDIHSRHDISVAYLEQLFNKLRKSGIVDSVRGPNGGYRLARPAEEICIATVLEAVDESVSTDCCAAKYDDEHEDECLAHELWQELEDNTQAFFAGKSLAALAEPFLNQQQLEKDLEPEGI